MTVHLTPAFSMLPAFVPESLPRAELPAQNDSSPLTCYPNSKFFISSDPLPAPLSPINPVSPSSSPLDLSSSPSSSSEEEEDGGRSSDPPSPDIIQHIYHLPALQQQLQQPLGAVPPPALPLPPDAAHVLPAHRSLSAAGLSLQALPQGVHKPGGPEDAHPVPHPPLRVSHMRQSLLQAVAAQRTHSHTHR
ncbi:hypothetical protein fugu_007229 [Takifugu bimaculatus]|uniref:Uncharacterized protein n=1 Tax=Takifugu bimaculatus TaxID=433685 RepID=A0A4Z2B5B4_9TELE|nr:hypothetical protein fugu_007229 [Takifugu bimaculatus]